jgi:molybdenum cofactor cytidylyltransferase
MSLLTTSINLAVDPARKIKNHFTVTSSKTLKEAFRKFESTPNLVTWAAETGADQGGELTGARINELHQFAVDQQCPLFIEVEGTLSQLFKSSANHALEIPEWISDVAVVCPISGLGKPISEEFFHPPELFARSISLDIDQRITEKAIENYLLNPMGALKKIPSRANRIAILDQADTPFLQAQAGNLAKQLLGEYSQVVITSSSSIHSQANACFENIAGIILAAGQSKRLGVNKANLPYQGKPFIRIIAETALASHLDPVIVVLGSNAEEIIPALQGLPIQIDHNQNWDQGQSSSIKTGLRALPSRIGGVVFLLVDQPQIPHTIISALSERHHQSLSPIIAPIVNGERGNPVLFDRNTFEDLLNISGDVGGRAIFPKYSIDWIEWIDSAILQDIDTQADYQYFQEFQQ